MSSNPSGGAEGYRLQIKESAAKELESIGTKKDRERIVTRINAHIKPHVNWLFRLIRDKELLRLQPRGDLNAKHKQEGIRMAITPYLYYEDLEDALKFLSKAFGFRKYGQTMSGPDGKVNHAAMKLGDDIIMMGYPGSKYKNPRRLRQATQSLYINIDNVDKHFERARKAGATILEEPVDTFYGHRRFGAEDPEGHQWYFAQEIKKHTVKKRTVGRSGR